MERARKAITNHFLFETETNAGQGTMLGYFHTQTGDPDFAERYLDAISTVDGKTVRAAAARYLDRARSNVLLVTPEGTETPSGDQEPVKE